MWRLGGEPRARTWFIDDLGSRATPRSSADETLLRCANTRSRPLPHRYHADGELLPTVASHRGRTGHVRRRAGPESGGTRPLRDRDRSSSSQRPRQAARAPTAAILALAPDTHPHTPLDVVPIWSHRYRIRIRHQRLYRAASTSASTHSAGQHRCLLTCTYRRSLPKRRRGRNRNRDQLRAAGHA
jgi:hypothetical protein